MASFELIARAVVVERGVALRNRFELVVEVEDDLRQRHVEIDLHAVGGDEGLVFQYAALVDAELDDIAQKVGFGDDLRQDIGFLDLGHFRDFGQSRGDCVLNSSPEVVVMRYETLGTVVMTSMSNSR